MKRELFASYIQKGGLFTKTVNVMDMKFLLYYASPNFIAFLFLNPLAPELFF